MFQLNKAILAVQAMFFTYMVLQNANRALEYLHTQKMFELNSDGQIMNSESNRFISLAQVAFVSNGIWYASVVIEEFFYREDSTTENAE